MADSNLDRWERSPLGWPPVSGEAVEGRLTDADRAAEQWEDDVGHSASQSPIVYAHKPTWSVLSLGELGHG